MSEASRGGGCWLEDGELVVEEERPCTRAELGDYFDEVARFIREELEPTLRVLREHIHTEFKIEAQLPYCTADEVNFGQWVGVYKVGEKLTVRVRPKVGEEAFERMLRDVARFAEMFGRPSLELVLGALTGPGFVWDVVSYSVALEQYTEQAFAEGTPPGLTEKLLVTEEAVGNLAVGKTLALRMSGSPLLVVKRRSAVPSAELLMLLARFHVDLSSQLKSLAARLDEGYASPLREPLERRWSYHAFRLLGDTLRPFVPLALKAPVAERSFIERAKRAAAPSAWFTRIVELYLAYLAELPFSYRFDRDVEYPLQSLPSSKVYELWVLALLLDALSESLEKRPEIVEGNKGYVFSFGDVTLRFNVEMPCAKFGTWKGRLRPDFVVIDREGRCFIFDAKYKEDLAADDIGRMLTYVHCFAERMDDEIAGTFLMLGKEGDEVELLAERTDVKPPIRLYVARLDPEKWEGAVDMSLSVIKELLRN